MYLSASLLESVLLKRLEHFQSLGSTPAFGLAHCLTSVLQANNSTSGVEWSSTDGHEDGNQEHIKVDISDAVLSPHLEAWCKWLGTDGAVGKTQYYAAAHAIVQDILSAIFASSEPVVHSAAITAGWQEDAADDSSISADRFKSSLAAVVTACSSDGTPQAAATCLASLLTKLQGQGERWQSLLKLHGNAQTQGQEAAAGGSDDDDDDLDALLGEDDTPDVAPASDKSREPSAPGATREADAGDADDDAASSLGLSRVASHVSTTSAAPLAALKAGELPRNSRYASCKSIDDPELRRELSGASSADLGDLPDDLDAMERQASNAKASTRKERKPMLAGLMASEEGKGHLADMPMDLRSWANFKDKQQPTGPQKGGRPPAGPLPVPGRADGGKQAQDQSHKGARGGDDPVQGGNPLHSAIIGGSASRQSAGRERMSQRQALTGMARHGSNASNESPSRQRSIAASRATNLSRKLSISEPGPMGPQAEWKHLPALGQASRLHPHELRQPSYGQLRTAVSRVSPAASAAALIEDKLPSLPSLAGARGQPPKAMELLRKQSCGARSDAHHADNYPPRNAHLPGLGSGKGPQGPRALGAPQKKSFRGDRDF